jgi:hypothetical protein
MWRSVVLLGLVACTRAPASAERVAIVPNAQWLFASSQSIFVATQRVDIATLDFTLYEIVDGAPVLLSTFNRSAAADPTTPWVGWNEGALVARRDPDGTIERQAFRDATVYAARDGLYVVEQGLMGFDLWHWAEGAPTRLPLGNSIPEAIVDDAGYFTYAGMGIYRLDLQTSATTLVAPGEQSLWPIMRGVGDGQLVYSIGNELNAPVELHSLDLASLRSHKLGEVPLARRAGTSAAVSSDAVFWGAYRFRDDEYERYLAPAPLPMFHYPTVVIQGRDAYWLVDDVLYRYPADAEPLPTTNPAAPLFQ